MWWWFCSQMEYVTQHGCAAVAAPNWKCLVRSLEIFQVLIRKILHAFFLQDLVMKLARFLQDLASNLQDLGVSDGGIEGR